MKALLAILLVTIVGRAAPLPDSVYAEIAAGIPDGVLDLTANPGPGVYELTDAKPGLQFNLFNNATVLATGVTLKPTEGVISAIAITGGTTVTGGAITRLQATGAISVGTTQLQCQYLTGFPVASFVPGQSLKALNNFTCADPTGFSLCYWVWGDAPSSPDMPLIVNKGTGGEFDLEWGIYVSGGGHFPWIKSGVTDTSGGNAWVFGPMVENSKWNFVALYFNQAGNQVGISVNGGAFSTLATLGTLGPVVTPEGFKIGNRKIKLSNVWLWKGRVLTLPEVQAIYNGGVGQRYADLNAGQKTGMLHAWELNEAAGADRLDSHGTNNLDEVGGPVAQSVYGWTGTIDRPLTDIMNVGDRIQINCGVQIYDAQEPQYSVFRNIAAISGHTITFSEPFPIACYDYVDSATMLLWDADPQKVGVWGGDGDTPAYLHPFSPGPNSFGYYQRGFGTSHDLTLYASGKPNSGLTIQGLTVDWSDSTHRQVTNDISVGFTENVIFRNLTQIKFRGNSILFSRASNSGVDGYAIRGDGTMAAFGNGSNFAGVACGMWGGQHILSQRGHHWQRSRAIRCESGSIDTTVENTRLTGGDIVLGQTPPQIWMGQHFGVYGEHYQSDGGPPGIRFKNCYFDTPTIGNEARFFTASSGGQRIDGLTFAGGEFPEYTEFDDLHGYFRIGSRVFGPRSASLTHNFPVSFAGGVNPTIQMPPCLYLPWPVLTIDTRTGLQAASLTENILASNPIGTVLDFANNTAGQMAVWARGVPGSIESLMDLQKILFDGTESEAGSHNYIFTAAEYFPEVTSTIGPRTPVVASTGGVLRASNGKAIALVAAP